MILLCMPSESFHLYSANDDFIPFYTAVFSSTMICTLSDLVSPWKCDHPFSISDTSGLLKGHPAIPDNFQRCFWLCSIMIIAAGMGLRSFSCHLCFCDKLRKQGTLAKIHEN